MAYTAEQVDSLFAKIAKATAKQSSSKGSEVKLRTAERDLLDLAEKARELLSKALKSDRARMAEVFGGGAEKFYTVRDSINSVEFSEMHAQDARWKDMTDLITTVDEVLKQMGKFKSDRLGAGAVLEIKVYRGLRGRFAPGERVRMAPEYSIGQADKFEVEPELPEGLVLDEETGVIRGMLARTHEVPERTYKIKASNDQGSTTFNLVFCVARAPPKSLYYKMTAECFVGEVIICPPEVGGGLPEEWSVEPPLPPGLSLRPTGAIAGAAQATVDGQGEWIITAANQSGQVTTTLRFAVLPGQVKAFAYIAIQEELLLGCAVCLIPQVTPATSFPPTPAPASGRWAVARQAHEAACTAWQQAQVRKIDARFTVEPALPEGMRLAARTGRIFGRPREPAPKRAYTVNCATAGETISANVTFSVKLIAPESLQYLQIDAVYWKGEAMQLQPEVNGYISSWEVEPALPKGLRLSEATGAIVGTPEETVPEGSSWTVTASNELGAVTAALSFGVKRPAPANMALDGTSEELGWLREVAFVLKVKGEVDEYTVDPPLPHGLELDCDKGAISGMPKETAEKATYTITARNESGSASVQLSFGIKVTPPDSLSYPEIDDVYDVGEKVSLTPQIAGGATSWSIEPELPEGLQLDPSTGCITGSPTEAQEVPDEYVITASNSEGSTTVTVEFGVTLPRPADLTYPFAKEEYMMGKDVFIRPELSAGVCLTFSVEPALPSHMALDPQTGIISGVPAAVAPAQTFIIAAQNMTGSTTLDFKIAIVDPVDSVTGINQQFAAQVEAVMDLAELPPEPESVGDWMIWMVHRAWLNDPSLTEFNFSGKTMPPPKAEPRVPVKLMKAMARNTNITALLLPNANMMKPQAHELAEALKVNTTVRILNIESNNLDAAGIKRIAEALQANENSALEQFRFSNQRGVHDFGRPCEQALCSLVEKNTRLVKLGFTCSDNHMRMVIDKAVLRNNDLARKRRASAKGAGQSP